MILNSVVVAEVHKNGDVVHYDPSAFGVDDVAAFMDLWGSMEDRNFFLATLTLTPLQENQ